METKFTTEGVNPLKAQIKELIDTYDPWGSYMGLLFGIAGELYHREEMIPREWEYSPGLTDDTRTDDECLAAMLGIAETNDLRNLGKAINRLLDYMDSKDLNY